MANEKLIRASEAKAKLKAFHDWFGGPVQMQGDLLAGRLSRCASRKSTSWRQWMPWKWCGVRIASTVQKPLMVILAVEDCVHHFRMFVMKISVPTEKEKTHEPVFSVRSESSYRSWGNGRIVHVLLGAVCHCRCTMVQKSVWEEMTNERKAD